MTLWKGNGSQKFYEVWKFSEREVENLFLTWKTEKNWFGFIPSRNWTHREGYRRQCVGRKAANKPITRCISWNGTWDSLILALRNFMLSEMTVLWNISVPLRKDTYTWVMMTQMRGFQSQLSAILLLFRNHKVGYDQSFKTNGLYWIICRHVSKAILRRQEEISNLK